MRARLPHGHLGPGPGWGWGMGPRPGVWGPHIRARAARDPHCPTHIPPPSVSTLRHFQNWPQPIAAGPHWSPLHPCPTLGSRAPPHPPLTDRLTGNAGVSVAPAAGGQEPVRQGGGCTRLSEPPSPHPEPAPRALSGATDRPATCSRRPSGWMTGPRENVGVRPREPARHQAPGTGSGPPSQRRPSPKLQPRAARLPAEQFGLGPRARRLCPETFLGLSRRREARPLPNHLKTHRAEPRPGWSHHKHPWTWERS